MIDRKICVECIYGSFHHRKNLDTWTGCNYLLRTGKKRPEVEGECLGFTPRNGKKLMLDPYDKTIIKKKGGESNG